MAPGFGEMQKDQEFPFTSIGYRHEKAIVIALLEFIFFHRKPNGEKKEE